MQSALYCRARASASDSCRDMSVSHLKRVDTGLAGDSHRARCRRQCQHQERPANRHAVDLGRGGAQRGRWVLTIGRGRGPSQVAPADSARPGQKIITVLKACMRKSVPAPLSCTCAMCARPWRGRCVQLQSSARRQSSRLESARMRSHASCNALAARARAGTVSRVPRRGVHMAQRGCHSDMLGASGTAAQPVRARSRQASHRCLPSAQLLRTTDCPT
jgi:hypothetical protein